MRSLYRSGEQRERVLAWCRGRLASWSTPHRVETIDTNLGPTSLVTAGEGDTVVYLPGTNFNAATGLGFLDELAARARVVVADLPGQPGLSADTRPSDELVGYAAWVTAVLRHVRRELGVRRVVLAGHSRGAAVALTAPPDLVDALVLLSPGGLAGVRPTVPMLRATLAWLLRPAHGGSQRLVDLMTGPGATTDPHLVEWLTLVVEACRTTGAPGPLPRTVTARWARTPRVVMVGEHDCFFAPGRTEVAAGTRLGVLTTVTPGAGHLLPDERPGLVAERVVRAGTRTDPSADG
ncbi:MAG: alpha/beta hydrolase [Nocardioidaceae bacterium]|nr:alpha/beta hydrolase [Nocardioidaceae bacterium]NUS51426.1 alpha/beta hydrolase [Nocardioidaceae bacterium]